MTAAALSRDALMPRRPAGMGAGLVLALLAHALLMVALAFSVRWKTSNPAGVEAELWAAVPQIAAPRAVAPEPVPVPPEVKPPPPPGKNLRLALLSIEPETRVNVKLMAR